MDVNQMVIEAQRRVVAMDAVDRQTGRRTPAECGPHEVINCIGMALTAAMNHEDWNLVAEALVMAIHATRR